MHLCFRKNSKGSYRPTDSKVIGVVIAFTALTTALNFVRIPMPFFPVFVYQLSDVALLVVLLLFGAKPAITVAVLNMIITIIFPLSAAGPIGPPYFLISVLAMFLGVYFFEKTISLKRSLKRENFGYSVGLATAFGIFTRTLIMLPLDYFVYGLLVSIVSGLSISVSYSIVLTSMPGMILYNITVPLVMIPTSYIIAKKVSKYTMPKPEK